MKKTSTSYKQLVKTLSALDTKVGHLRVMTYSEYLDAIAILLHQYGMDTHDIHTDCEEEVIVDLISQYNRKSFETKSNISIRKGQYSLYNVYEFTINLIQATLVNR